MTTKELSVETRQRLLEAAGEVFAERGFRDATVREICEKAKANIAGINYYFGDKEELYAEVIRYAASCAVEEPPERDGGDSPEAQLRAFIRSRLTHIFDVGRPSWHAKLMSREMIEPTSSFDKFIDEEIRPKSDYLHQIIRSLVGPKATEEQVHLCSMSVVGQCVFYHHSRAVIVRLNPDFKYDMQDIEKVGEHIEQFSLGALKQLREQLEKDGR